MVLAVWKSDKMVMRLLFFRKTIFWMVMIFVLRVPVVCEYLHDRHAKKNAPLQRSALCWAKLSCFGRVKR